MVTPIYTRALPGGGYVAVESHPNGDAGSVVQLAVERRADPQRRLGHAPPIVAQVDSPTTAREVVVDVATPLVEIAADNVAVARAIQRWAAQRPDAPRSDAPRSDAQ
jgi:hypothetical protein